jgi:flavin-dependent dehydrogenase
MSQHDYDVAIIGGGPGGSTLGTLLRKYEPSIRVLILEREVFPRDHVGESQLPPISAVLDEMGCWDKVEAANFPIKVGATFRWGAHPELWDFEFLPLQDFRNEPRPGKYEGFRKQTAFQVDRAIYDDILLRHARESGCEVRQNTAVTRVDLDGDRVRGLELKDGEVIRARHYVDASGHAGILRKAFGVQMDVPTSLQNLALWDYWDNAKWAASIGVGGTRIQVMSQSKGWLWFIPLGPTRTSIGFVCPQSAFKSWGRTPEDVYQEVVAAEERIGSLIQGATRSGEVRVTRDWSFVSSRCFGENWFLVGEALGFADPILSAGLTLTHTGARELAYTILALDRKEHDAKWLRANYAENQQTRVRQHIRFADYWYAANGQLTDLQEHCQQIAADSGIRLEPQAAWAWLAQGGFSHDVLGQTGIGGYDLSAVKQLSHRFLAAGSHWVVGDNNVFKLDVLGAKETLVPLYENGKITQTLCLVRGRKRLVLTGMFKAVHDALRRSSDIATVHGALQANFAAQMSPAHAAVAMKFAIQVLEVMVGDRWVKAKYDPTRAKLTVTSPEEGAIIHKHRP